MAGDETVRDHAKIAQITRLRHTGGSVSRTRFKHKKIQTMLDVVSEYGQESSVSSASIMRILRLYLNALIKANINRRDLRESTGPARDK